jgi:hypothetical protein
MHTNHHDNYCHCAQCASASAITNLVKTGEAAINRFDKQTQNLLSSETRDAIAETIARRLEDIMDYQSAIVIGSDLAQSIQNDISDEISEIKQYAETLINMFVKTAPIVISNAIIKPQIKQTPKTKQFS